jgi:hypothetical protein
MHWLIRPMASWRVASASDELPYETYGWASLRIALASGQMVNKTRGLLKDYLSL